LISVEVDGIARDGSAPKQYQIALRADDAERCVVVRLGQSESVKTAHLGVAAPGGSVKEST
jgi:hypothetical protein